VEYSVSTDNNKFVVKDRAGKYEIDLRIRLFEFSKNIFHTIFKLPQKREYDVFRIQLSRSATAIGANYEEAQASSVKEFRQRIQICLRETRETNYWLRLIMDIVPNKNQKMSLDLRGLIRESEELMKIFGAISTKLKDIK